MGTKVGRGLVISVSPEDSRGPAARGLGGHLVMKTNKGTNPSCALCVRSQKGLTTTNQMTENGPMAQEPQGHLESQTGKSELGAMLESEEGQEILGPSPKC